MINTAVLQLNEGSGSQGLNDLWGFQVATASPLAWLAIVVLLTYLVGAISLWARKRRWSVLGTVSFALGCFAWFIVTGLSINEYASSLVSVLLFQQITLLVVVPPFLLMGRPGLLLLKAAPHRGPGRLALRAALGSYRSRMAKVLLHPAMAIIIAFLAFPALYFSDAISWIMALPAGHDIMLGLFIILGVIGGAPLWSLDPLPRSPSYVVRLIDVVIEIQIHAVFGLIMLLSSGPMFAWFREDPENWGITRALDQAIAGGLIWTYGELPLLIVLIVTLSKWRKTDMRKARHLEAQEDAALDEYNAFLATKHTSHE